MLRTQFISQVYWPDYLLSQEERGFLVGWNLENFQCCISNFVMVPDESFDALQGALFSIDSDKLLPSCCLNADSKPIVLGEWVPELPPDYTPPLRYQREGIWLTLTRRKSGPLLHSLYSCGCLHRTSCQMIKYMSAHAHNLHSLSVSNSAEGVASSSSSALPSSDGQKTDLAYATCQINNSEYLGTLLSRSYIDNANMAASPEQLIDCGTDFTSESDSLLAIGNEVDLTPGFLMITMLKFNHIYLSCLTLLQNVLEAPLNNALLTKFRSYRRDCLVFPRFFRSVSLKDISITSAYMCERSRLLWHCFYTSIDFVNRPNLNEETFRRKQWMFVFSRLIFVCSDILFGVAFGLYLWNNRVELLYWFHDIGRFVESRFLLDHLKFLRDSPYGIKFNQMLTKRLSGALGNSIISLSSAYSYLIGRNIEEFVMFVISFTGCFGFSFQMLLVVDLIRCLTVHIAFMHMALSVLHYFQLKSLGTLFYMFQGKKLNYLRNRVDTLETNKSQLFFGTVYFTILVFLFPTFAAYFFLFTMLQFCVVLLQATLWSFSIMVKEFPWCELFLYFCDPSSLSNGVHISIDYIRSSQRFIPQSKEAMKQEDSINLKKHKKDWVQQTIQRENSRVADPNRNSSMDTSSKVTFSKVVEMIPSSSTPNTSPPPESSISQQSVELNGCVASTPDSDAESLNKEEKHEETLEDGEESSTSSSGSEDIGWARVPSEDDSFRVEDDSIFAMENVWGSSDNIEHLSGERDPPLGPEDPNPAEHKSEAYGSLKIRIPEFSYFAEGDDSPLSPLVSRHSHSSVGPEQRGASGTYSSAPSCTTYLSIQPLTPSLMHHLMRPYLPYLTYWFKKESALRVLRGLVKGKPALDLQMIRAAVEISSSSLREDKVNLDSLSPRSGPDRDKASNTSTNSVLKHTNSQFMPQESAARVSPAVGYSMKSPQEVNAVSRSPNIIDLWSLLLQSYGKVRTFASNMISKTSNQNRIRIHGISSSGLDRRQDIKMALFFSLIFTISLCLLSILLGTAYSFFCLMMYYFVS